MGSTAENLHDRFPGITRERADAYAVLSQQRVRQAYADGVIQESLVGVATRSARARLGAGHGRRAAAARAPRRRPWPRCGRRSARTAGSPRATPPGSTTAPPPAWSPPRTWPPSSACRRRCGWSRFAFAGVDPEVMGVGPIPATEKALAKAGLTHRRHRRVRDQRGLRRPGAGLPRPLRRRRRRPAGQPVRRGDRARPPAGQLGGPADDPPGPRVPRPPRGALRPDHDVHRAGHGRHGHLGEPGLRGPGCRGRPRERGAERGSELHDAARADGSRDAGRGGHPRAEPRRRPPPRRRHRRADHPRQRAGPHPAEHASAPAAWPSSTPPSTPPSPATTSPPSRSPASRSSSPPAPT